MVCGSDADYFAATTKRLGGTYARENLDENSKISGGDVAVDTCRIAPREWDWLNKRKEMKSRKMSAALAW